jgi:hypothetical protein
MYISRFSICFNVFIISVSLGSNESCPVCADQLPSDINDIYCSANSVVKAAIRRLRKARLLLDVQSSHQIERLRSTIAFVLSSNCSCSPLDNRKYNMCTRTCICVYVCKIIASNYICLLYIIIYNFICNFIYIYIYIYIKTITNI